MGPRRPDRRGRPAALGEAFHARYGEAAGERRVSTRLALPGPPADAETRPWSVRAVDLDVFDHVNNASHWPILEEVIAGPALDRVGVAEIEYLVPVDRRHPCRAAGRRDRRRGRGLARRRRPRAHRVQVAAGAASRVR